MTGSTRGTLVLAAFAALAGAAPAPPAAAVKSNIDPRRDRHMHQASLELVGDDEVRSEWTELADASPVMVVKSHLVRKAR